MLGIRQREFIAALGGAAAWPLRAPTDCVAEELLHACRAGPILPHG
jgi:hypothetical protein